MFFLHVKNRKYVVRFEKECEDNGLNLPMVIIKQAVCQQSVSGVENKP
jgi:hypothetical protein